MEDKYAVKLLPRAYRDLDGIYEYIAETLIEPGIAAKLVDLLEEAIFSLECMPKRGALRKTGAYANKGYRQLLFCSLNLRRWSQKYHQNKNY